MELQDRCDPFWREITLRASDGRIDAEIIDNVHHFVVRIHHDGAQVTDVTGTAVRVPWVTCPGAIGQLALIKGTHIGAGSRIAVDQTQQCTHMLDLARLALAQATRTGTRRYNVSIHYDRAAAVVIARLERDREVVLDWTLQDGVVATQGNFCGHNTVGRSVWSEYVLADPDLVEAGLILRRAIFVFRSRRFSAPRSRAADTPGMTGVCYSFQPGRAEVAFRPDDFTELP